MQKYFNVAGPCFPGKHYMLDATERLHNEVIDLIKNEQYFVFHAARQCGKTTLLLEMTNKLNKSGEYYALYCTLENTSVASDPEICIPAIINALEMALENYDMPFIDKFKKDIDLSDFTNALVRALRNYCKLLDKPLVIFFDEADCLTENALLSFLRQLRNGYVNRIVAPFPSSVALVGMRNLRDYKVRVRDNQATLGTASPFNIIKESLTIRNFTKDEVAMLYHQHTEATGQLFEVAAIALAFEQTQGQPWLVNAIACEIIEKQLKNDYTLPITAEMVTEAIQTIIKRRDVHIDQLLDKLKEQRVQQIIEPMILGETGDIDRMSDDYNYVKDLGLIKEEKSIIMPANPIYKEVIIRMLSYNTQQDIAESMPQYQMPRYFKDGKIDINYLLTDFQQFWRENSEIWEERYQYKEAAPHLIMQGFLQRVVNGGGLILREFATGKKRMDLCLLYEGKKYPIELKLWRGEKYFDKSVNQIADYSDIMGCKEAWLIIFNKNKTATWDEKIYHHVEIIDGKTINIFGC
jgi:hypothetical protein